MARRILVEIITTLSAKVNTTVQTYGSSGSLKQRKKLRLPPVSPATIGNENTDQVLHPSSNDYTADEIKNMQVQFGLQLTHMEKTVVTEFNKVLQAISDIKDQSTKQAASNQEDVLGAFGKIFPILQDNENKARAVINYDRFFKENVMAHWPKKTPQPPGPERLSDEKMSTGSSRTPQSPAHNNEGGGPQEMAKDGEQPPPSPTDQKIAAHNTPKVTWYGKLSGHFKPSPTKGGAHEIAKNEDGLHSNNDQEKAEGNHSESDNEDKIQSDNEDKIGRD